MSPRFRMIFMGKSKESVLKALGRLVDLNIEVVAVVVSPHDKPRADGPNLSNVAKKFQILVCSDTDIYEHLAGTKVMNFDLKNIDMVVSFLFPRKIKKPLINLGRFGCINFHSAPLPEYRGWGIYNAAILNGERHWGVSAHFVDENFDTGDIIKVDRFDIDPKKETAFSLEHDSQKRLLELFDEIMNLVIKGESLPRKHQEEKEGTTYSKPETLSREFINFEDSEETVENKIRAFWYPPFAAKIILNDKKYFLINPEIMADIFKRYIDSEKVKN